MKKRACLLVLIILGAIAAFAADEKPLPKDLPPYGPVKPFKPPQVTQQKLPNGLEVWLVPQPGFPKVAFELTVRGGTAADAPDHPGFAEMLVSLLNEGTKTRNSRQLNEAIQAAGGSFAAAARSDALFLTTQVLASKAEAALALISDIAQNATFPEDEVQIAKAQAADNLRQSESQPQFVAARALNRALFGDHPYGTSEPTQPSIAATTREELLREYARRFRPDQAVIVVVGDFAPAEMQAAVAREFGHWAAPSAPTVAPVAASQAAPPHVLFVIPRAGSVQTTLMAGTMGPERASAEYPAARIANAIYGNMFGSRLILNVREDKGYSYSPFSALRERRASGTLVVQADVRNAVTGASFNEITYELNRMATTEPTETEVRGAKTYLLGNEAIALQSRASVADQLATLWSYGLPPEQLARENEAVTKVTVKDVAEIGRKYYPAARFTIVAVGEQDVLNSDLRPFALPIKPGFVPEAPQQ